MSAAGLAEVRSSGRTDIGQPWRLTSVSSENRRERVHVSTLVDADSPRAMGEDISHIKLLAALSADLPPILVHRPTMRVIDGMHRLRAAVMRGADSIDVEFVDGTEADAFVLAVQANQAHGLPLSLADRRCAAARIIGYHPEWSNRRIAATTGLAPNTIGAIRRRSTAHNAQAGNCSVGRDGKIRPRDAAARRRCAEDIARADPNASLRDIARAAGVSVGTASNVRSGLSHRKPSSGPGIDEPSIPEPRDRATARISALRIPTPTPASIDSLSQDPSIRFSESGRALLRLLAACMIDSQQLAQIIAGVPPHRRATVAELARACAGRWTQFADSLA